MNAIYENSNHINIQMSKKKSILRCLGVLGSLSHVPLSTEI